jgi:hypothetical protein
MEVIDKSLFFYLLQSLPGASYYIQDVRNNSDLLLKIQNFSQFSYHVNSALFFSYH